MRRLAWLQVCVLAVVAAVPASGQLVVPRAEREQARGVPDQWGLTLGSFWQTFNTRLRLDGDGGETGTFIDVETDLALPEDAASFQITGFYRLSDHSRVDMAYIGWNRRQSTTLDRAIRWGDVTFDVGAQVTSELDAWMLNVVYKYSLINNEKVTFGLNGGISSLGSSATLSGVGTVSKGEQTSPTVSEEEKTIFPVPVLGVHFEMALARGLAWRAEGNFFAASISGYDGRLNEVSTSISYLFTRNVGLGAGFASTTVDIDSSSGHGGELDARFGYSGVIAYLTLAF